MSSAVLPSLAAAKSNSSSFLCWVLSTAAKGKVHIILLLVWILLANLSQRCIENKVIMVRKVTMFWTVIQMLLDFTVILTAFISDYRVQLPSGSDEFLFSIQRSLSTLLTTTPNTSNYELLLHAEILLHMCLGKVDKWGEVLIPSRTLECKNSKK